MPKSPTKTRPRTVAALMTSARALFIRNGYHATSISDICEHAGLTRGAFYSNYPSKEHLFLALYDTEVDRILGDLERAARDITDGDAHPVQRLLEYLAAHRRDDRQWFLVSMEFTLHAARNPDLAAELAPHEDRLTTGIANLLARLLPQSTPDTARDVARLVTALHEGATAQELIHGAPATAFRARVLPHVIDTITTAMTTPAD
ncbi:transcriptional regulator, TetR family [Streptoalloteichus tenebrarius]|uniref:Transcriptional regulator, TetR family n=1 Tax=Streptoalloteichus tenebrarius (strain ATCC 17920 / DSM 40477 / JCM 4838 / CBS 697.72 / NBRC 16177 / NCIMB 11028 / NRRL B-12390 / A12253. 1 / ISP 5477) TaxID=1933 RepID=A0ABT1HNW5_STRSD|nr:TetR/AcrR family transcriptional regulator [Streptoalloteichus tenebrarius]MCP2257204.1 transcriptional regulator, TetR family [Streptoalloteichus tenebrarius]BFE98839.1 TetR/AcrR family transcriptional regulator [Streptoalloteichus tenebrarius]